MISQLSWVRKRVLVVGNGHQGQKKKAMFEHEGAIVRLVDLDFDRADLEDVDLVYACTSDPAFNHRLVQAANQRRIFSASVHFDEEATFHPLKQQVFPDLSFGYTSHGAYPLYLKEIEHDIEALYARKWKKKLALLGFFRPLLLGHREWMELLLSMSTSNLIWLQRTIQKKKGIVLVFAKGNGHADKIEAWLSSKYGYLWLDESIAKWYALFSYLGLEITTQPMLLSKGMLYRRLEDLKIPLLPLIQDDEWRPFLKPYDQKGMVFIVHPSKQDVIKRKIASLLTQAEVIDLHEPLPHNMRMLLPFFILDGKHVQEDVKRLVGDEDLMWVGSCLLDLEPFWRLVETHIEREDHDA